MPTEVDRTTPGSINDWRLTYDTDAQKWTNDRPGDGKNPAREDELRELFARTAVKRAMKAIEKAIKGYVQGEGEDSIKDAVDGLERDVGDDNAKHVVRHVYKMEKGKEQTDLQKKVVEGLSVAKKHVNRKQAGRRGARVTEAGVMDVLKRIERRVRDWGLAERLKQKVLRYLKTKQERDDLTLQESGFLYGPVDYGEQLPLSKKRMLDIDWTNHAEYRSDLRDIDPQEMNEDIRDWLKEHLQKKGPDRKKVKMKVPEGVAVVDFDTTRKPSDADVITVWGSSVNPYLNTPPTELKGMIEREDDPAKKRQMKEALSAWRITTPGPFRKP